MKYVSFTFDDGRLDNYEYALPIMKKYGLTATLFCTTGYVDKTWEPGDMWASADKPLTVENLREMKNEGWEIALHGDCHTTSLDDSFKSFKKLNEWGFGSSYGFSVPNSSATDKDITDVSGCDFISYVRKGRGRDTSALSSKVLFALYTYLNIKCAYRRFNFPSINALPIKNPYDVKSVVVRRGDKPKLILDLLKKVPNDTLTVLMLHSILPSDSEKYPLDPWTFSTDSFDSLCKTIKECIDQGELSVVNMNTIICGKS